MRFAGTERYEVLGTLGEGGDGDHLLRLKDEFRTAVDLRHGNLVRLGELVEDDGVWCFIAAATPGAAWDLRTARIVARVVIDDAEGGYYGCIARANALLYSGNDTEAARTVASAWPLVERSLFLRVPFTRVAMREVRRGAAMADDAAGDTRGLRLVARTAALARCQLDGTEDVVARGAFLADGVVKPERLARLFCPPFFARLGG